MKKALLLFASAALLLVGCAKEQIAENNVGEGLQTVSFTVGVESAVTKAVADNDGKAAKINHWVIQVIDSDNAVYHYKAEDGVVGEKTHTFDVPLIKGQTYDVLFWADTKGAYNIEDLTNVSKACYTANADSLDAFYAVVSGFSTTQSTKQDITLKRPFAQLNVVFTDLEKLYTTIGNDVEYEKFVPKEFVAKAKVPASFDVRSQTAGAADTVITVKAATDYNGNYVAKKDTSTLYMDYMFASKDTKDVVDIDFSFVSKGVTIAHNFTSIPLQRNYRTNIKGDLMSANAKWEVEVDPNWDSLEDGSKDYNVNYYEPSSITDAQNYIANNDDQKAKAVDLSKYTVTTSDFDHDSEDKTIKFELKTTSPKDMVNFTLPEIPQEVIDAGCTGWKITHETGYPTDNVNVTAPEGTIVTIDAPNSHVTLNGSVYTQATASTGNNTLVVPAGVTIDNLIVKKGAVEIHGTVNHLTVTPEEGKTVCFRECEGLSAEVFSAIKGEGHDYIDSPMYTYELVGEKYNIYKLLVVAMIGEKEYPSIAAAVAAVPANNTELVTIKVMSDVVINSSSLSINKNNVVLDGQGHTIAIDETDTSLDQYLVEGAKKKYGSFQMIKVSGNDVTLKNLTLDSKNYRGASLATTNGGKNVSYENIVYKGLGSGHYYGTAGGDGTLKFKDCTFETHGYAIHTAECQSVLEVSDCEIHGWVSYGDKTKSATFTNTHFYSTTDQYNGVIATIRPYCATTITKCTFSKEYLVKYKFDGLTVRSNVVVSLKDCSIEGGELCDIANITCPDDPWVDGGVMAIDATGNATDGFTAGTFVAKQASDIKVAGLNEVVSVEGKENVYTIAPKQFDETTVAVLGTTEYSSFEAAMQAALDAKGGTITLVKDVTLSKGWDHGSNIGDNRDKYSFVLNLNGKTIFRGPNNYHISLCDNDWTVIDETGEGTINKASDGTSNLTYWCNNGHDPFFSKMAKLETCPVFILNGGTYSADGDFSNPWNRKYGVDFQAGGTGDNHMAICKFLLNNATIRNMRILNGQGEIKGGTISGQILFDIDDTKYTQFGIQNSDLYTIISGGVFTLDATTPFIFQNHFTVSNLKIKGGTFNFNPSVNYSACIPAGYTSQDNGDGTWTVVAEN